jgi:hypothetical protein
VRVYKPLGGCRWAVLVTFGALIVLDLLAIGSTALELDLVDWIEAGEPIGDGAIEHNDTIDNGRSLDLFFMASDGFDAVVAALAVLVVWRITERLDGRAAALSAVPPSTT